MNGAIRYYLLMVANPLSSSEAAVAIYRMMRRLDILSRDITIFLPGFHPADEDGRDDAAKVERMMESYREYNEANHSDYHGHNPIYHTYCDIVGDIYFNDADFAQFVIDLENESDRFEYDGKTQLVLLPSSDGEILYDNIVSYDLEPFFDKHISSGQKLEEFMVSLFKLMLKDDRRNSLDLIGCVDALYRTKLYVAADDVVQCSRLGNLEDRIIDHMRWRASDDVFFISYSTKDEYHAFAIKALLERNGKRVWIAPDGIPDGYDYACAIPSALRISSRVVVLLSHNSANSTWVRREVGKAISNDKKIDGVLLGDFTIADLKAYDHFDFLFEGIQVRYSIDNLFENRVVLNEWLNER